MKLAHIVVRLKVNLLVVSKLAVVKYLKILFEKRTKRQYHIRLLVISFSPVYVVVKQTLVLDVHASQSVKI